MPKFTTLAPLAAVVLCMCALLLTGLNVHETYARSRRNPTPPLYTITDWRDYVSRGERLGSIAAPVTAILFSDYQCPGCRNMHKRISALLQENSTSLTVVIRHFPLEFHAQAEPAARAAVCAAEQDSFREFNDLLFAQVDSLGLTPWSLFAREAGVQDTALFVRCMVSERTAAAIRADVDAAERLHLFAAPSLLLNGEVYFGVPWDLERILARHIQNASGRSVVTRREDASKNLPGDLTAHHGVQRVLT